jgi:hypothetical protein
MHFLPCNFFYIDDKDIRFLMIALYLLLIQGQLTYGRIGEWRFDKRSYLQSPPPRNLSMPPPGVPESVVCLKLLI